LAIHWTDAGLAEALTERELEVLWLVADGDSNQDIARKLLVSLATVKTHINPIFGKLDAESRLQVVARARGLGLLQR
jgi:LuxR family maltose regulon positive regulatory protein